MKLLLRLVISTLAVLVASNLLDGVYVADISTALVVAVVLGILNTLIKPILVLLTLPITLLTLGLFYLIINVIIIYAAASLVSGFSVDGFLSALFFSFIVSIVSSVLGIFLD